MKPYPYWVNGTNNKNKKGMNIMQKRIHRVTVCLTEEEHLRLNEMCKATRLTMSKLIRFLLSGYLPAQAPPAEYSVLIKELRAVGNNLNQITRAVNAGMISAAELNETREELKKIWQSLNSLPRAVR